MILNKYIRTNFMNKETISNGDDEWDLLSTHWDFFKITRPLSHNRILYGEIARPDLLSYRIYGSSEYWWILCKFNQIDDVWNDMEIDGLILVPDIIDIENYYSYIRRFNREV